MNSFLPTTAALKLLLCLSLVSLNGPGHTAAADTTRPAESPPPSQEPTRFTYLGGIDREYEKALLRLALDKTQSEYGPYVLVETPHMSDARGMASLKESTYPSGIRVSAFVKSHLQSTELSYIQFPVYLGVLGYRVCYMNDQLQDKMQGKGLDTVFDSLVHGQGELWLDTLILRENGYKVVVGNRTENLYKMLSAKRMDLFCRGTNELDIEQRYVKRFDNISLDQSIALHYRMFMFFYTSKENTQTSNRLSQGLKAAFEDGSLQKIWQQHFGNSIDKANMKDRKIIPLKNSQVDGAPLDIEQFLYKP